MICQWEEDGGGDGTDACTEEDTVIAACWDAVLDEARDGVEPWLELLLNLLHGSGFFERGYSCYELYMALASKDGHDQPRVRYFRFRRPRSRNRRGELYPDMARSTRSVP